MKIVNMLATFNEKDNVGPMIETLERIAKDLSAGRQENPKYEFVNLVVDSHSPDGTGEVVKELAKKRKNLFLLETPRGLGISLIQGYNHAIKELKADVVIPNDCDFQWDPELIPQMLEKIEQGYDVVVPSRHAKGGRDNFNFFRKLTHFVSNTFFNYYWAGIREVKDLAGNFKAIRVKNVLDKVKLDKLNVKGFVIQSTMIYELSKTGAKFIEIPAVFGARRAGESKVGLSKQFIKDIVETIKNATRIRIERSRQFLKFGTVGFIGFVVNSLGLELFYGVGLTPGVAAALGAELAIISNFTWNNLWTFSERKIQRPLDVVKKFFMFNLTSAGAIAIQYIVVGLGTRLTGDGLRQLWLVVAIGFFIIPYNWFMYNRVIWNKRNR